MRFLVWNVLYTNSDTAAIASTVAENHPDIIGINEWMSDVGALERDFSSATSRKFKVQPNRTSFPGFGTDIYYDSDRFDLLEDGVDTVYCGGHRAANWAVLQERTSRKIVVTGGIHLSYCGNGCDVQHECELGMLYDRFEEMRTKYPDSACLWMGDLNRSPSTRIFQNLLAGTIGSRAVFEVEDVAQTNTNTYYTGGPPIDHVLGEKNKFRRIAGGRTGQGVTGQLLSGADHFPVFADVEQLS